MAAPERRPPAPDGQQGQVEPGPEVAHPVEEVGVAGEVDAAAAAGQEADRLRLLREPAPSRVVVGLYGGDGQLSDAAGFAGGQLGDRTEAAAREEVPRARWHQQGQVAIEPAQRAVVGVVAVQVGDQDRVEVVRRRGRRRGAVSRQRPDPVPQERVSQQPGAVEVDQDGSVADVGERV